VFNLKSKRTCGSPIVGGVRSAKRGLPVNEGCSTYTGRAGDYCTVIPSDLKAIELGTRFVYAQAVVNGVLDSSIVLDPPGPGNNKAFVLWRDREVHRFQASADVSCPTGEAHLYRGRNLRLRPGRLTHIKLCNTTAS
jgi:hypothetical protein